MSRFCSMFGQLLKLFPRTEFQALVKRTHAERHARGFTCWGQFVAMLFCQLGRAHSLREICGGLRSCEGKLSHLGITAPNRSTLAYANEHRPWQLYRAVFHELLARCRADRRRGELGHAAGCVTAPPGPAPGSTSTPPWRDRSAGPGSGVRGTCGGRKPDRRTFALL